MDKASLHSFRALLCVVHFIRCIPFVLSLHIELPKPKSAQFSTTNGPEKTIGCQASSVS